jgi:hypothetical protein
MKSRWFLLVVSFSLLLGGGSPSYAQFSHKDLPAALTGRGLARLANDVVGRLRATAAQLGEDAAPEAGGVADELAKRQDAFDSVVADRLDAPLRAFSLESQALAARIYDAALRLRDLVDRHQQCVGLDEALFLSGVRTIGADLRVDAKNLPEDRPQALSFAFAGHSLPFVVPQEGGRFTVRGRELWQDAPPELVLRTQEGATVATLQAEREGDDNAFSARLEPSIVAANAGACLTLAASITTKRDFLFVYTKREHTELLLPMCMPQVSPVRWMMSANIRSDAPKQVVQGAAGAKTVYFENSSCADRQTISARLVWDGLTADQRLTSLAWSAGELTRGNNQVAVALDGSHGVAVSGWLDRATCIDGSPKPRLLYSTIFQASINPSYAKTRALPDEDSAATAAVAPSLPETKFCVDLKKASQTPRTEWWFSILQRRTPEAGEAATAANALYESRHLIAAGGAPMSDKGKAAGYDVEASFDPRVVDGTVRMCAVVSIPEACRY